MKKKSKFEFSFHSKALFEFFYLNKEKIDNKYEHWKAVFDFIYLTKNQASGELDLSKLREHIVQMQDSEVKSYGLGMLNIIGAAT